MRPRRCRQTRNRGRMEETMEEQRETGRKRGEAGEWGGMELQRERDEEKEEERKIWKAERECVGNGVRWKRRYWAGQHMGGRYDVEKWLERGSKGGGER